MTVRRKKSETPLLDAEKCCERIAVAGPENLPAVAYKAVRRRSEVIVPRPFQGPLYSAYAASGLGCNGCMRRKALAGTGVVKAE